MISNCKMACIWECKKVVIIGRLSFQLNMSVTFKSYHHAKICYKYHYCHQLICIASFYKKLEDTGIWIKSVLRGRLNVYFLRVLIGRIFHKITRDRRKALWGLVSRDLRKCLKRYLKDYMGESCNCSTFH